MTDQPPASVGGHLRQPLAPILRGAHTCDPNMTAAFAAMELDPTTTPRTRLIITRRVLAGYGALLIRDPEGTAAALGFDSLCDVLNVNTVEREQARREGLTSLEELAFVYGMEDSAERRDDSWKDGPLFNACHAALAQFIKETPRALLPDPFGPGGPLYGVPVRVLHPDGTIITKRPDLTLHDSKGSRVVKGSPPTPCSRGARPWLPTFCWSA